MGDRCYLQITMRRKDLEPFGNQLGWTGCYDWWDDLYDEDNPDIVTVDVQEANYGWVDDREAAAEAGFLFIGQHDAGGTYGPCSFAAVNGVHMEMPVDHDGNLVMALDGDLNPITDIDDLKAFRDHHKAAGKALGLHSTKGGFNADGSAEDRSPALCRTA